MRVNTDARSGKTEIGVWLYVCRARARDADNPTEGERIKILADPAHLTMPDNPFLVRRQQQQQ